MSISPKKQYVINIRAGQNINEMIIKQKLQNQKKQISNPLMKQRSHSKSANKSSNARKSIYSKSPIFKDDINYYLEQARNIKANINKGLQFTKTLNSFNQQQRCLQHNNIITLYCVNDKRLLCVYCIYGIHKHRAHKLLPAYEHLQYIVKDVINLQDNYNQYINGLDQIVDSSKSLTQFFQNLLKNSLSQIQTQYMKRKLNLQELYEKQKHLIIKTYEQIIVKSYQISSQYEQMKFNIWQYQARYNLDKKPKLYQNKNGKSLIYEEKQRNKKSKQTNPKSSNNRSIKLDRNLSSNVLNNNKQPAEKMQVDEKNNYNQIYQKYNAGIQMTNDFRQIMSKHIVLNHIIQEMRKIQPYKLDQKTFQKKVINKANFKFLSYKDSSLSKNQSAVKIFT